MTVLLSVPRVCAASAACLLYHRASVVADRASSMLPLPSMIARLDVERGGKEGVLLSLIHREIRSRASCASD